MNDKLTSFCGLYCLDCIPSNKELFSLIEKLDNILDKLQFNEYAKLKSRDHPKLLQYHTFLEVLKEIRFLRCPSPCRLGGGNPECKVRLCCQNKKYIGCWECNDRYVCSLLNLLKDVHPNLLFHLDLVRDCGLANWEQNRKVQRLSHS